MSCIAHVGWSMPGGPAHATIFWQGILSWRINLFDPDQLVNGLDRKTGTSAFVVLPPRYRPHEPLCQISSICRWITLQSTLWWNTTESVAFVSAGSGVLDGPTSATTPVTRTRASRAPRGTRSLAGLHGASMRRLTPTALPRPPAPRTFPPSCGRPIPRADFHSATGYKRIGARPSPIPGRLLARFPSPIGLAPVETGLTSIRPPNHPDFPKGLAPGNPP
jgi:hypothetical protein